MTVVIIIDGKRRNQGEGKGGRAEKGYLQKPSAISNESLDIGGDTYSSVFLNYVSNLHVH